MNLTPLFLAFGFLIALAVIALVHKFSSHYNSVGPKKTKDRIWTMEKAFFGVAVTIIVLADAKDILALFQGGYPSEDIVKNISIGLLAFVASGFLLLLAHVIDAKFGDE